MADGRVSQVAADVLAQSDVPIAARLSQVASDVLVQSDVAIQARLSQVALDVLVLDVPAPAPNTFPALSVAI